MPYEGDGPQPIDTDDVRSAYVSSCYDSGEYDVVRTRADFDRWLALHDAQVREAYALKVGQVPPEPAVVQRVADSAWAVMRERGIEPRFENESDGVLDPDGVFLAIGEHLVSRTGLPIDFQIGHEQTPDGSGR